MSFQVTSLLAGLFSLFMVLLSLQVSMRRLQTRSAPPGSGRDETLHRRIRAHGNFIEYAPTALIVVGLIEFASGANLFVWCLASAFFVSRLGHAIGMLFMATPLLRAVSMLIQHAAFVAAGAWLLARAL